MDWRNNRYFCVRFDSDKDYAAQMAQLKALPVRLRPSPNTLHFNNFIAHGDEFTRRGYYNILVGCHLDVADQVLLSIREIVAGKTGSVVELLHRKNKCSIVIDGKSTADELTFLCGGFARKMAKYGHPLKLSVVVVGDDPASKVYVRNKERACKKAGILSEVIRLPHSATTEDVSHAIYVLSNDSSVTGILVQLPLPHHINEAKVLSAIPERKDVDHFSSFAMGELWKHYGKTGKHLAPCTPAGILHLLHKYGIPLAGRHAVILGRSNIVGKPLAAMLLGEDCTVTICHSKTQNLTDYTRHADILIAAIGRPKFVTADMVKPGATVIDVGINRLEDGSICGDVDYDSVKLKAGAITPVPGGVGPMTVAMLLFNLIQLYKANQ